MCRLGHRMMCELEQSNIVTRMLKSGLVQWACHACSSPPSVITWGDVWTTCGHQMCVCVYFTTRYCPMYVCSAGGTGPHGGPGQGPRVCNKGAPLAGWCWCWCCCARLGKALCGGVRRLTPAKLWRLRPRNLWLVGTGHWAIEASALCASLCALCSLHTCTSSSLHPSSLAFPPFLCAGG